MREYTVEHASQTFKWTFRRMLPSLPGPGTPAFAELCKGLHPYGMTPSKVVVDVPSTRLGDVSVGIGLLENRLTVRFTASTLEILINELWVGDEEKLIPIADLVFAAAIAIDADAIQGKANVKTSSHLKLAPGDTEAILSEHTNLDRIPAAFAFDAVIYKVNLGEESKAQDFRVMLAKSLAYENTLFVDITGDYEGPATPTELATYINTDDERVMEMIGLQQRIETEGSAS
jgi:hypothetical protein